MALEVKRLVAHRQCCGSPMSTYELSYEYGTQRYELEFECDECGRIFKSVKENPLTIRLILRK